MSAISNFLQESLHLLYPHHCLGCGNDLLGPQDKLCAYCLQQLPHTGFAYFPHNPVERIFYGRIPIEAAHSEFYFAKGQLIQSLIHQLKYKGKREIGHILGGIMAETLLSSGRFAQLDYILPLPMYAHKEYQRGYNQATIIAEGLSEKMQVPMNSRLLQRSVLTETQTHKHRTDRWTNVEASFALSNPQLLENKKVLLVDDVITTGASLEACAARLSGIPGCRINIATLAMASK